MDAPLRMTSREEGTGSYLIGSATAAKMIGLSMALSSDEAYDSISFPRVMEIDGCKHLIPRSQICTTIERATALAPLTEPLLEIIRIAQRNDEQCKIITKERLGKRDANHQSIQSVGDSNLLRQHGRIYVLNNPALREEVIKLYYNDPLIRYFGVDKTLELLRRNYY